MFKPLPRAFFEPSAARVAPRLLGQWLVRVTPAGPVGGPIVEAEAHLFDDPACHAYRGQTNRNRTMWGPPGFAYVYFIYGNHSCVNAVCQAAGVAEAVLIRAVEAQFGRERMFQRRPVPGVTALTSGPGKLCAAMEITRELDGVDLCRADSALFIAENPELSSFLRKVGPQITTERVGISRAADRPLRFYLPGSRFVSRRDRRQEMLIRGR